MSFLQSDPAGAADVAAFRQRLTELGWIEGQNIRIEFRWPGADVERARVLAKELVALKPDVMLERSTQPTAAITRETEDIPIEFVNVPEPHESEFMPPLHRPY